MQEGKAIINLLLLVWKTIYWGLVRNNKNTAYGFDNQDVSQCDTNIKKAKKWFKVNTNKKLGIKILVKSAEVNSNPNWTNRALFRVIFLRSCYFYKNKFFMILLIDKIILDL